MLVTIIKIEIFLIILFVVYNKLTIKYVNPYKTVLYYGKKGCGKTTLLTKISIRAIRKGKKVYSSVKIPGTRYFDPLDLKEFKPEPNSVVCIDEIGLIWDNRDFKKFEKGVNVFFKYARQYKIEVHMFSQVPDIDLKIRNLCDSYWLVSNKLRVFSYAKKINKVLTVKTDIEGKGNLVDSFEFAGFFPGLTRKLTFIPAWGAFYQSFDPPNRRNIPFVMMPLNDSQTFMINHKFRYRVFILLSRCKAVIAVRSTRIKERALTMKEKIKILSAKKGK